MPSPTRGPQPPLPGPADWHTALYGPHGFYRRTEGPRGHFTTSTHGPAGLVFAEAIAALADREGCAAVVDVGAGRGELLSALAAVRPDLGLTGVDIVARPAGLPERAGWLISPGGAGLPNDLRGLRGTLVIAHEWLDVVPCTLAPRSVLTGADRAWADQWWPVDATEDDLVEVGRARDEAWSDLLSRVDEGVAVAVDYGHTRDTRPAVTTFAAYANGAEVTPAWDGTTDLTAHVAMDSLTPDQLITQRAALDGLGVRADLPPHELASRAPSAYLEALQRANAAAQLLRPDGLGGFLWAITRIGPAGNPLD